MKNLQSIAIVLCTIMLCLFQQSCASTNAGAVSNDRVCKATVAQTEACAANDNGSDQQKIFWQFDTGG